MFRSKQLHKIHIFKHSRNFSKKQECLRSKEQESTRQTSNETSKQYILKKKEGESTMINRDSKKMEE